MGQVTCLPGGKVTEDSGEKTSNDSDENTYLRPFVLWSISNLGNAAGDMLPLAFIYEVIVWTGYFQYWTVQNNDYV